MSSGADTSISEELKILDARVNAVKLEYEQYFLGTRPREPVMSRGEIQKQMIRLANTHIQNTGDRFKFNSLNSRFMTYKRRWDDTQRKVESGTYERHVFKANLHERERESVSEKPAAAGKKAGQEGANESLFDRYMEAASSCGQNVKGLTPEKLQKVVAKQEAAIKKKMGVEKVKFRVEVEAGKVKLKASAVRNAS